MRVPDADPSIAEVGAPSTSRGAQSFRIDLQRKRPRPSRPGAFVIPGARDRIRTGDPHVGKAKEDLTTARGCVQAVQSAELDGKRGYS